MPSKKITKGKKYNLYLFSTSIGDDAVKEAMSYRFNRITPKYVLVYTDELLGMLHSCHYHIIDEKEIGYLSDSEKVWLLDANIKIIAEETAKQQDKILKSLNKRIRKLEIELKEEYEKLNDISQDGAVHKDE